MQIWDYSTCSPVERLDIAGRVCRELTECVCTDGSRSTVLADTIFPRGHRSNEAYQPESRADTFMARSQRITQPGSALSRHRLGIRRHILVRPQAHTSAHRGVDPVALRPRRPAALRRRAADRGARGAASAYTGALLLERELSAAALLAGDRDSPMVKEVRALMDRRSAAFHALVAALPTGHGLERRLERFEQAEAQLPALRATAYGAAGDPAGLDQVP